MNDKQCRNCGAVSQKNKCEYCGTYKKVVESRTFPAGLTVNEIREILGYPPIKI